MAKLFHNFYGAIALLLALSGIFFFGTELLLSSIIFTYICCPLVELIVHEYWQHQLYRSKNNFISVMLDIIGHLFVPNMDRISMAARHQIHHRLWKTEYDFTQKNLNNGWIKHLLTLPSLSNVPLVSKLMDKVAQTLDKNQLFIVNHRRKLILTFIIVFTALFGFEYLFYFYILPIVIFYFYFIIGSEIIPHHPKTINEEKDYPWLLPIIHNLAYHKRHHTNPGEIFFGGGYWKYLNLQYYYHRLFFKV